MLRTQALLITPEEEKQICATYEKSPEELVKDVEEIKEWIKTQLHLPQDEDDFRIKNMLTLNKCNVEKTKKKFDVYYSAKHIVPEIYEDREPLNPSLTELMDNITFFPLPHLTPDLHRVFIFRFMNDDSSKFNMNTFFKLIFSIFDLRMMCDLSLGDQFVVDFEHAKMGHIVQFTPTAIKKSYTVLEKAYSDRIKGFHFVHLPPAANVVVALVSSILSKKLANRVVVHKNLEDLHKKIAKEVIPIQYGGTGGNMEDLYDDWRKYLCSQNDWIKNIGNKKSNEELREGKSLKSNMFGLCQIL